jgi:hypothetical protein
MKIAFKLMTASICTRKPEMPRLGSKTVNMISSLY